jgi:hypothetical protein
LFLGNLNSAMLEMFVSELQMRREDEVQKIVSKQDVLTKNIHACKNYLEEIASVSEMAARDYATLCDELSTAG